MKPIFISSAGLVSAVGHHRLASCAAIRTGITGFGESRFMYDGEWLEVAEVPFEIPVRGRAKLLEMAGLAIKDALGDRDASALVKMPLVLCVAESDRAGRCEGLDSSFLRDLGAWLEVKPQAEWIVLEGGRTGGIEGLEHAARLIAGGVREVVVVGVDSYLKASILDGLHADRRIATVENSDGFIPGEGAAALIVGPEGFLACEGFGKGIEPSVVDPEKGNQGLGLAEAIREALDQSGKTFENIDYRLADHSGEQTSFKEASLALVKVVRPVKEQFDVWHPADCIGELGAATVPAMIAVAFTAAEKGYSPGPGILCHAAGESGERAVVILREMERSAA